MLEDLEDVGDEISNTQLYGVKKLIIVRIICVFTPTWDVFVSDGWMLDVGRCLNTHAKMDDG